MTQKKRAKAPATSKKETSDLQIHQTRAVAMAIDAARWTPESPRLSESWTRELTDPAVDLRIAVLGTSVSWGQGLWPADKACVRCADMLLATGRFSSAAVANYAQSGAKLWPAKNDDLTNHPLVDLDLDLEKRSPPTSAARNFHHLDGETPSATPYIWDQAARASSDFKHAGVKPTFVWLDAGANDIGFMDAVIGLDENKAAGVILKRVQNMTVSLERLLTSVWNDPHLGQSPIILTGYFLAVSHEGFNGVLDGPGGPLSDALIRWLGGKGHSFRKRVVKNMASFRNLIRAAWIPLTAKLKAAGIDVTYVEGSAPDTSGNVTPVFDDESGENVMFAANAALWPNPMPPYDSLHGHRQVQYSTNDWRSSLDERLLSVVGAFAHPNRLGAQLYAQGVFQVISRKI